MHCEKFSNVFFIVLIATCRSPSVGNVLSTSIATYQSAAANNVSAGASRPTERDASEAAIPNVFEDFELVFEADGGLRA
nr:hypothetical protein [Tanacetum cinerariifolium]